MPVKKQGTDKIKEFIYTQGKKNKSKEKLFQEKTESQG